MVTKKIKNYGMVSSVPTSGLVQTSLAYNQISPGTYNFLTPKKHADM